MNEQISALIVLAISLIPYAALSWGYSTFSNAGWPSFWRAFGVLVAVRAFFSIIEGIGGILVWRLYGRRIAVSQWAGYFRDNHFPPKQYFDDDFGNYCARLTTNYQRPTDLAPVVHELQTILLSYERRGMVLGMRMNDAVETAFEQYQQSQPRATESRFS
jgi:hypothetical protein